jgi:MFS transporter, UMF1 family
MSAPQGVADLSPLVRRREQRAWYWYDWANSGYVTTVGAVLFAPYLTSVAERDACGFTTDVDKGLKCTASLSVLGLSVSPGSLVFYVITLVTIVSAFVLPVVGAVADRSPRRRTLMARLAWAGSLAAGCMFFVEGTNWQLGAFLLLLANLALGASLVVYDAILIDIAGPDERDRVSSRGWALGYLGGGVLLLFNLALVQGHDAVGLDTETAVRVSLLSAAVWWGGFTFVPWRGLRDRGSAYAATGDATGADGSGRTGRDAGLVRGSFTQLRTTLRDLRHYPVTLTFLVAYLFYNDGIQTVIVSASTYGENELGFGTSVLISTILLVQYVAFLGALLFGRVAERIGARRVVLVGLLLWMLIVSAGYFLPENEIAPFLVLAAGIGLVLGGTQALSRSFFSQLVPRGREAEYFSLYQAGERGTSWLGTLLFGLVHQWTDSYRPAIFALIVFFLVGFVLLLRVDPVRGIREAGNQPPAVV